MISQSNACTCSSNLGAVVLLLLISTKEPHTTRLRFEDKAHDLQSVASSLNGTQSKALILSELMSAKRFSCGSFLGESLGANLGVTRGACEGAGCKLEALGDTEG